jgi:hypothetical protein
MGYTINLIQDVATGGLWNGDRFVEVLTQEDYAQSQFITGDPESIPDNFAGLSPGEYRVMTFLTYGNPTGDFPMINGQPFSNFAGQPVANAVDVTFTGNGGEVILNPSSDFDAVANLGVGMFLIFTLEQVEDNYLEANPFEDVFEGFPEYAGTYIMQVYYNKGTYYASGFSYLGAAGPISAQYLFIY